MSQNRSVWRRLHCLFDTDDGSLPRICLTGLTAAGVEAVFDFLRSRAATFRGNPFWHRLLDREEPLDAHPDAARLVAERQADEFHVLAQGLSFRGVTLPDLGVFVWPTAVDLDYRMGPEWDESKVLALFELLRRLHTLDPGACVTLEPRVPATVEEAFLDEWSAYCRGQRAP
jgi:hypothetical protein